MKRTHIQWAAVAAACTMLCQSAASLSGYAADAYIFSDGFESGAGAWAGRGGASVQTSADNAFAGSSALYVSGRTDKWHGAEKDISSVCTAGQAYAFSACVRYDSGPQSVNFMLSVAYKNADGQTEYGHIAQAETMSGFWVQLYNDSFTLPAGSSDPVLYIETESGSTSFYLDEVICADKGTAIDGPQPVKFTLGDANYDGRVNAADLSLAKQCAIKASSDRALTKAADVDLSGTVDIDDVKWYVDFLTAQKTDYPEPVKEPVKPFHYDPALQFHEFPGNYLDQSSNPGKVIEEHYQGPQRQSTCYVYLPASYDESKKYNILYLLHGGGEDETTLFFHKDTHMQNIFDHMIENGDMDPMIIVTPTWNQSGAENYWKELREQTIPYIESKYSTYAASTELADLQASRFHRAYGGFSMGSISTWGVLMHDLDIIAYYMPLSGEYKVNNLSVQDQAKLIKDAIDNSGLEKNEYFIFCATGSNDMAQPNMTPLINELKKLDELVYTSDLSQGNFYYMMANGKEHWWQHVRHYVYDILPYFFHEGQ